MLALTEEYKKNKTLHHAIALEGERKTILPELFSFLGKELGIMAAGNPDLYFRTYETFGIDEGRALKEAESKKAVGGGKKIFIICFSFITRETQNALLKLFEEPSENTHIFLVLQNSSILLPTLRSRLHILVHERGTESALVKKFLSAGGAERIALFHEIIEEKNKEEAIAFLNNLEDTFRKKIDLKQASAGDTLVFDEIFKFRGFLHDRSASVKLLLEHIALTVPQK